MKRTPLRRRTPMRRTRLQSKPKPRAYRVGMFLEVDNPEAS